MVVRLEDAQGEPLPAATLGHCVELSYAPGEVLESSWTTGVPEAVRTLVVVAPGVNDTTRGLPELVSGLIDSRAADETMALFSAESSPIQLSTFRDDSLLLKRMAERAPAIEDFDLPRVLSLASYELSAVGEGLNWLRQLVVLSPSLPLQVDVDAQFGEAVNSFVVAGSPESAAGHLFVTGDAWAASSEGAGGGASNGVEQLVEALVDRRERVRAAGFVEIGFCPGSDADPGASAAGAAGAPVGDWPGVGLVRARVVGQPTVPPLVMHLAQAPPEEQDLVCDPPAVAGAWPAVTSRVEFEMTAEQRSTYDGRVQRNDQTDFELSVRPSPETGLTPAAAHLRGQTSLFCERKSYTVDLEGPNPRFSIPGLGTDELQLVSMCTEELPIHYNAAHELMHELGLSIIGHNLVELIIDGETQGAYLLLEKHKELFLRSHSRVRTVIRRRVEGLSGDDDLEEKFTAVGVSPGALDYQALIDGVQELTGPELEAELRGQLDLDQYLRWMALLSLLHSGDYSDELFLIGTETRDEAGGAMTFFHINGWDADDIFHDCHYDGRNAFADEFDLTYCAESELDQKLLSDPHTYGLYVARLVEVIDAVPVTRFREAVDHAIASLLAILQSDAPRSAMVELLEAHPEASDLAGLESALAERADELEQLFSERRAEMLENVAAYNASLTP